MAMDSGTPRFEQMYKAPAKSPPGAVAGAILTIIFGAYSIISSVVAAVDLTGGANGAPLLAISPFVSIAFIYSGYAILKCRDCEYDKGLWLIILLSVFMSIFQNINGNSSIPAVLVILYVLFRYGGYIAAISASTVIISYIVSAWVYVVMKSGYVFFILEFAAILAPLLAILILLCLNWKTYKVCMHPKRETLALQ